ncbi:MAG: VWA domain-containing protein, partial [Theionarchaea archaeon]|nr:VWA domain-containing protein [Theionarchaea archaeon]
LFLKIDINPTGSTGESLPVAVCLLIDRSGSMVGKKLRSAKEGACNLVVQLTDRDYCGVVTFESKVSIVIPGQFVRNPQFFEDKIKEISLGGTTELYRGLEAAFEVLQGSCEFEHGLGSVRRIILLSDGQPTDDRFESEYRSLAQLMREMGISITALGIGKDYNEDLLSALAEESGGMWYHITSPDRIPVIFSKELDNMKTVVLSRPELILKLSQGVELDSIYKSSPDVHPISNIGRTNNEYRIPLMDIKAGEPQTITARLAVSQRPEGEWRIAQVTLMNGTQDTVRNIIVKYTPDESLWNETDPYPRTLFAVTETQIKVKHGLSGDKTAFREAETQLKTLIRDREATRIKDIADRTVVLEEVLDKTRKAMSEEEKKVMKSDLTRVRR